jgi:Adenovirus endoprotease
MKSHQIENVLSKVNWKNISFLGCFPADRLPNPHSVNFKSPICFIGNTDTHLLDGTHWVAFLWNEKTGILEYFCPLGIDYHHWPLFFLYIKDIVRPDKILFNLNQIESDNSNKCGQLCIEFLVSRDRDQSYVSILNNFSKNKMSNDIRSVQFVRELVKK